MANGEIGFDEQARDFIREMWEQSKNQTDVEALNHIQNQLKGSTRYPNGGGHSTSNRELGGSAGSVRQEINKGAHTVGIDNYSLEDLQKLATVSPLIKAKLQTIATLSRFMREGSYDYDFLADRISENFREIGYEIAVNREELKKKSRFKFLGK